MIKEKQQVAQNKKQSSLISYIMGLDQKNIKCRIVTRRITYL